MRFFPSLIYQSAALLLLSSAVLPASVGAGESTESTHDSGWRYLEYMKKPHRWISRRLGDTSRRIDGFFASEDLYDEVSGTYGEFRMRNRFSEI